MAKTQTVSINGNEYDLDPDLADDIKAALAAVPPADEGAIVKKWVNAYRASKGPMESSTLNAHFDAIITMAGATIP